MDPSHRTTRLIAGGVETQFPQQQQDVHRGVPAAVPGLASPRAVGPLEGEQKCTPALGRDLRALGRDLPLSRIGQISHGLPADRRVRIQQPVYDRAVWLWGLGFG